PDVTASIWLIRQRTTGCWNNRYPAPRQWGWGYITGGTVVGGQAQDLEPAYYWNNRRTSGGGITVAVTDFPTDECGNGLTAAMFIQEGREYYLDKLKPGYIPYTYPHPLTQSPTSMSEAPTNLQVY